jgi:hypothetical protein
MICSATRESTRNMRAISEAATLICAPCLREARMTVNPPSFFDFFTIPVSFEGGVKT